MLVCSANTPSVGACGNAVNYHLDLKNGARRVRRIERLVRRGAAHAAFLAAVQLEASLPTENDVDVYKWRHQQRLLGRFRRIKAIALVRADGLASRVHGGRLRREGHARQRRRNLDWAYRRLARMVRAYGKRASVSLRAQLAEAMAKRPATRAAALAMLEGLAAKDLLPDAWAHRTLAELYQRLGNTAARDRALARCKVTAGKYAPKICPAIARLATRTKTPTS